MSPHPFWHGHHRFYNPMFCRPSRFIWFSIGSLATFAWMHYHQHRGNHLNSRRTAQVGYDGCSSHGQWGRSTRLDEHYQQQQPQWGPHGGADDSRLNASGGQPTSSPVMAEAGGRSPADREFDLREMSRNAEETVSSFVCCTWLLKK